MRSILIMAWACLLGAAEISGTTYPATVTIDGAIVPLRGMALQRWKLVVKVHTTAWWQEPATAVFDDTAKALELHYFHDIPADGFRQATREGFSRGRTPAEVAALAADLATWNAAYVDIREGDRYRIEYHPGRGTRLLRNGVALVTIPGTAFMQAIFGIWLGSDPVDSGHRDALLKGL